MGVKRDRLDEEGMPSPNVVMVVGMATLKPANVSTG